MTIRDFLTLRLVFASTLAFVLQSLRMYLMRWGAMSMVFSRVRSLSSVAQRMGSRVSGFGIQRVVVTADGTIARCLLQHFWQLGVK
jgi:hypothetical protein